MPKKDVTVINLSINNYLLFFILYLCDLLYYKPFLYDECNYNADKIKLYIPFVWVFDATVI